jgi:chorismate mutase
MQGDPGTDPRVQELRAEITSTDHEILHAVNRRLELVRQLKKHKAAMGYDFLDKSREEALLAELERENSGPLSVEGLREFHTELLDLTKRELS